MELGWLALGGIDLFVIYYFFVRGFIVSRYEFSCGRGGFCCRVRVKPTEEDVQRIIGAGHEKEYFIDRHGNLKRPNGFCVFLDMHCGQATCTIHDIKPKVCAGWPNKKMLGLKFADTRCCFYKKKLI